MSGVIDMNPLLIFQLPDNMDNEERMFACETIKDGIKKGSLIIDSRICILSYDKNGDMNYCTPKYAIKTE